MPPFGHSRPSGVLPHLPAASAAHLTGKEFFPHLISGPFHQGLVVVFLAAAAMSLVAAFASVPVSRPAAAPQPAPEPALAA